MKKLISILITVIMLVCFALPAAYADNVSYDDGASHEIDGNVIADSGTAVKAEHNGTDVTVNGNVESTDDTGAKGVSATDGATVEVTENVSAGTSASAEKGIAVYEENSDVTIGGNASAGYKGKAVEASSGTVTVDGNATALDGDSALYSYGVLAHDEAEVTVSGNAETGTYGCGVYAYDGASVTVGGNAEAGNNDVGIWADNGMVTVGGSVSASAGQGVDFKNGSEVSVKEDATGNVGAMISFNDGGGGALVVEGTVSGATCDIGVLAQDGDPANLPDIVVGTLANSTVEVAGKDTVTADSVFSTIKYIIKAVGMKIESIMNNDLVEKDASEKTYDDSLSGKSFDVANETDVIILSANAPEAGYRLKGISFGSYADSVEQTEDGNYKISVRRGGNLNFEAEFEKISSGFEVYNGGHFVGERIMINNSSWIITGIDREKGEWSLSCTDTLTEDQMKDLDGTLKTYLSDSQLSCVITNEAGNLCSLATPSVAAQYFNGNANHMSIVCSENIIG